MMVALLLARLRRDTPVQALLLSAPPSVETTSYIPLKIVMTAIRTLKMGVLLPAN